MNAAPATATRTCTACKRAFPETPDHFRQMRWNNGLRYRSQCHDCERAADRDKGRAYRESLRVAKQQTGPRFTDLSNHPHLAPPDSGPLLGHNKGTVKGRLL